MWEDGFAKGLNVAVVRLTSCTVEGQGPKRRRALPLLTAPRRKSAWQFVAFVEGKGHPEEGGRRAGGRGLCESGKILATAPAAGNTEADRNKSP